MRNLICSALVLMLCAAAPEAPRVDYSNDLEKAPPGKLPEELMVFPGDAHFTVEQEPGNRFVRLKPTPVDGYGLLFGADDPATTSVEARIRATSLKKRLPELGVGLGGTSAYRLWLMPATGEMRILRGEQVMASRPYEWKSGVWTRFKLHFVAAGQNKWQLRGKVWVDGSAEPSDWMISWEETEPPMTGRASVGVSPYPETPVDFDDLKAGTAK